MNISHDEYGPIDVDELMEIHQNKMRRRLDNADTKDSSVDGSSSHSKQDPQECVENPRKRSAALWASVRGAHKKTVSNIGGRRNMRTYAQVVAE